MVSLSATLAGLEGGAMTGAWARRGYARAPEKRFDGVAGITTRAGLCLPQRWTAPRQPAAGPVRPRHLLRGRQRQRARDRPLIERCVADGRPLAQHVALVDTNMTLVATQAGALPTWPACRRTEAHCMRCTP